MGIRDAIDRAGRVRDGFRTEARSGPSLSLRGSGLSSAAGGAGVTSGRYTQSASHHANQYGYFSGYPYAIINTIANRLAAQPIRVARRLPRGVSPRPGRAVQKDASGLPLLPKAFHDVSDRLEVLPNHRINKVLDNPNSLMVRHHLLYSTFASIEITGRAYWWMYKSKGEGDGRDEIWPLPTHWVEPVHEDGKMFAYYRVSMPGTGQIVQVPTHQIVPFFMPDPSDPFASLAPMQAMARTVMTDWAFETAQRMSLENGVNPGLAIIVGKPQEMNGVGGEQVVLSADQRAQLVAAVKRQWRGVSRFDEPMILDGLIKDVKQVTTSPREMAFKESGPLVRNRLTQGWGMNPITLGEIEGVNYASSGVADHHVCRTVFNPRTECNWQTLSCYLPAYFSSEYGRDGVSDIVVYQEPVQPTDPEMEMTKEWGDYDRGILSQNDLRRRRGLPPLADGDRALTASGWVPVVTEDEAKKTPPKMPESGGKRFRPLRSFLTKVKDDQGHEHGPDGRFGSTGGGGGGSGGSDGDKPEHRDEGHGADTERDTTHDAVHDAWAGEDAATGKRHDAEKREQGDRHQSEAASHDRRQAAEQSAMDDRHYAAQKKQEGMHTRAGAEMEARHGKEKKALEKTHDAEDKAVAKTREATARELASKRRAEDKVNAAKWKADDKATEAKRKAEDATTIAAREVEDDAMSDRHEAAEKELKAKHKAEETAQKSDHKTRAAAIKTTHKEAVAKIKADRKADEKEMAARHEAEMTVASAEYDRDMAALERAHDAESDKQEERHASELEEHEPGSQGHNDTVTRHTAEVKEMRDRHEAAVAVVQDRYNDVETRQVDEEAAVEEKYDGLESDADDARDEGLSALDDEKTELEERHEEERSEMAEEHETESDDLTEARNDEDSDTDSRRDDEDTEEVEARESAVADARQEEDDERESEEDSEDEERQERHDAEVSELDAKHTAEQEELTAEQEGEDKELSDEQQAEADTLATRHQEETDAIEARHSAEESELSDRHAAERAERSEGRAAQNPDAHEAYQKQPGTRSSGVRKSITPGRRKVKDDEGHEHGADGRFGSGGGGGGEHKPGGAHKPSDPATPGASTHGRGGSVDDGEESHAKRAAGAMKKLKKLGAKAVSMGKSAAESVLHAVVHANAFLVQKRIADDVIDNADDWGMITNSHAVKEQLGMGGQMAAKAVATIGAYAFTKLRQYIAKKRGKAAPDVWHKAEDEDGATIEQTADEVLKLLKAFVVDGLGGEEKDMPSREQIIAKIQHHHAEHAEDTAGDDEDAEGDTDADDKAFALAVKAAAEVVEDRQKAAEKAVAESLVLVFAKLGAGAAETLRRAVRDGHHYDAKHLAHAAIDRAAWEESLGKALPEALRQGVMDGAAVEWALFRESAAGKSAAYRAAGIPHQKSLPMRFLRVARRVADEVVEKGVIRAVVDNVLAALEKVLKKGKAKGLENTELADYAISRSLVGSGAEKAAAEVSRSEGAAAVSGGQQAVRNELAKAGAVLGVTWVTRADERVRPTHRAASGQTVRPGGAFVVGGLRCRYPGDPDLPGHERQNCRCAAVTVYNR